MWKEKLRSCKCINGHHITKNHCFKKQWTPLKHTGGGCVHLKHELFITISFMRHTTRKEKVKCTLVKKTVATLPLPTKTNIWTTCVYTFQKRNVLWRAQFFLSLAFVRMFYGCHGIFFCVRRKLAKFKVLVERKIPHLFTSDYFFMCCL